MAVTPINLSVTNITPTSARFGWVNPLQALISALFGAGEQGAIYIPNPRVLGAQALFQDSAGTVPVTADGDPFGLILDQSKGLELGPELFLEEQDVIFVTQIGGTSGAYDNITGEFTNSSGGATFYPRFRFALGADTNKSYKARIVFEGNLSVIDSVRLNDNNTMVQVSPGIYEAIYNPAQFTGAAYNLSVFTNGTSVYSGLFLKSATVRDIAGNQAFQTSSSKRPSAINVPPWKAAFDGVDDELIVSFASSLGSNCTIARAVPGTGASILTGQTIGTSYTIDLEFNAFVIVDRALTSAETTQLTAYLDQASGV